MIPLFTFIYECSLLIEVCSDYSIGFGYTFVCVNGNNSWI